MSGGYYTTLRATSIPIRLEKGVLTFFGGFFPNDPDFVLNLFPESSFR